ncbi:DUF1304 domain-containing protein [Phreatobacter stygius]|uniref:DUF1304 domain-containing protein n=1 Tax=Phreatobacter stygius TaxID=1940610 RepID=A0A4D7AYZ8_9HYPH|nr:DUF1304 domain-containing protein [Phreatobacter stygius]
MIGWFFGGQFGRRVKTLANIAVALVALEHVDIPVLEMFFWDKPKGMRAFGMTQALVLFTR